MSLLLKLFFICNYYLKKFIRFIFHLFVQQDTCVLCNKIVYGKPLCDSCENDLLISVSLMLEGPRCKMCGRKLLTEINVCTQCRKQSLLGNFSGVYPLFMYVLYKKKLLYTWKIAGVHYLTEQFAKFIFFVLNEKFNSIPIVPVPPRPDKIKKKGWDQIDDLSKTLEYLYNVPVLRILTRYGKVQQKKLNRTERLAHKGASYGLCTKHKLKSELRKNKLLSLPEKVILLDDVITTGVTLEACCLILKDLGIQEVYAVSLFIVP